MSVNLGDVRAQIDKKYRDLEREQAATPTETPAAEENEQEASASDETPTEVAQESTEVEETEVEAEEGRTEEQRFESIDELAQALELDLKDFSGQVKATVNVDGQKSAVPLADLIGSYETVQAAQARMREAAESRKQAKAEREQGAKELADALAESALTLQALETHWVGPEPSTQLDQDDYLMQRAQREDRQKALQQAREQLKQQWEAAAEKQRQAVDQDYAATVEAAKGKLAVLVPGWDEKTMGPKIKDYVMERFGYKEADLVPQVDASTGHLVSPGLTDPNLTTMAYESMLWQEAQKSTRAAAQKAKKVPKVIHPNSRPDKAQTSRDARRKKFSQATDLKSAAKALRDTGVFRN